MEHVYKLVTAENYEIVADYIGISYGAAKSRIGEYVNFVDVEYDPQWLTWTTQPHEKYMTVTDGYMANRLAARVNRRN